MSRRFSPAEHAVTWRAPPEAAARRGDGNGAARPTIAVPPQVAFEAALLDVSHVDAVAEPLGRVPLAVIAEKSPERGERMTARWVFSACVALAAGSVLAAPAADFADALAGGPDYWVVTGLCLSARPTLHETPAPNAKRVAFLAAGTVVRNHGCRMGHGARWCKVESVDKPILRGWMAGNCLRETAGPK